MYRHLSRPQVVVAVLAMLLLANGLIALVSAAEPGNEHFQRTWDRTDKPVKDGEVARTWMWGPEAFTEVLTEPYVESPGGERDVQYFDKSRMEITYPDEGDPNSFWYVTNGLLVVEMVTGELQLGDDTFEQRQPADIPVAGDADDMTGPTYETFGGLLDPVDDHGQATIIQRVDREGSVSEDSSLASMEITFAHYDEVTGHNVAEPFWSFMTSTGTIYQDGEFQEGNLFPHPVYATGRPITEPYFATVTVADEERTVLIQCFERRCLTYTADNPEGWQVEAGNVGQHYYAWRYDSKYDLPDDGDGDGDATPTPDDGDSEDIGDATPTESADATATPDDGDGNGDDGDGNGDGDGDNGNDDGDGSDDPTATPTATEPDNGDGNGDDPTATATATEPGNGDPTATATSTFTPTPTSTFTPTPTSTFTPTPTATPIPEPDIDVLITNPSGSIDVGILESGITITAQVTNNSSVAESVDVDVSIPALTVLGSTVCPAYSNSTTAQVAPNGTQSVSFNYICDPGLLTTNISATITVDASVSRDGLSDSATDTQTVTIIAIL